MVFYCFGAEVSLVFYASISYSLTDFVKSLRMYMAYNYTTAVPAVPRSMLNLDLKCSSKTQMLFLRSVH